MGHAFLNLAQACDRYSKLVDLGAQHLRVHETFENDVDLRTRALILHRLVLGSLLSLFRHTHGLGLHHCGHDDTLA
ncbi:unnamed protein product [Linum trigynum]|uniref:Uncharacterized protein n=1 Tax=Linum trigynum TaxID=586398 RepID=A0AAV2CWI7_9ROSI